MTTPVRASNTPFAVNVEAGKDYWWCSCGQSKAQPFCDGSHKGTSFLPVKFNLENVSTHIDLCGCKLTTRAPFCDGTTCKELKK